MKKMFLTILIMSSLLLLPACGTQVGQKSASQGDIQSQSRNCDQEALMSILISYSNGEINKDQFVAEVEPVCPSLLENELVTERSGVRVRVKNDVR